MRALRRLLARLGGSFGGRAARAARERELSDELESHLQLDTDERIARGVAPDEARRQALLALGGVEATKERMRDTSRARLLEDLVHDVRFALRGFAKDRLFFAVVVLTFALGIGANTAIFAAVNAVLLRPLPYPDGDRLVMLWATDQRMGESQRPVTPADFADWRAATHSFAAMAPSSDAIYALTGDGEPESIIGYRFAPEMFAVLGVPPALGRTFTVADGGNVVVLGDRLWRRRYHADPAIVGHAIRLDGESYTVLGVMPPSFTHPAQTDLWTPLVIRPEHATSRTRTMIRIVARLAPGATVASAGAELRAVAASLATAHPDTNAQRGAKIIPLRDTISGDARPALLVLLGAVAFVLLLTSSNIAGLSLARAARRGREIALRTALGAGRSRIVRQLLTESVLLGCIGGLLGVLLALWSTDLLVRLFPRQTSNLSIPHLDHIPLDGTVLLFGVVATLLAGTAAGLTPAIRGSRVDFGDMLKGGRASQRSSRIRPLLVAAQVGLALMLSAGAGLTIRSALARGRALGFDARPVFTARVLLDRSRYPDETRRRQFLVDLTTRLHAAPGIRDAGTVLFLPLCGWSSGVEYHVPGHPDQTREVGLLLADPSYFTTLRIPIRRGRNFTAADDKTAPKVALIDESLARRVFGDDDAVGKRLDLGTSKGPEWHEIVGVVGDITNDPPPDPQRPMLYVPIAQEDSPFLGIVARGDGDPTALATTVRDAVWAIDRDQPVSYAMTMQTLVDDAFALEQTSTVVLSFFALVALVIAAMGVYGVLAHTVLERRQEIGIRLALGAPRRSIVALVTRRMALMAGVGLAVGLGATLAAGRVFAAMLHGASPYDAPLFAATVGLLAAVAALAAFLPLRRALRTDPMIALRDE